MERTRTELPYGKGDLAPVMSAETIDYHYGKHYQTYLDNMNKLIKGTEFENAPIEQIIQKSSGALYNNAAQAYNHELFFLSFTKERGGKPQGEFMKFIEGTFGSFDEMKKLMTEKAVTLFGSGWAWLAMDGGNLIVTSGSNAYTPVAEGLTPLLPIDVWEHAYYIDYRNRRAEFADKIWEIIDWDKVAERAGF